MADYEQIEELLPGGGTRLTPAELLAASTNSIVGDAQDSSIVVEAPPAPIGRSVAWDFGNNQAIMAGHGPLIVRGEQTIQYWIEKALRTTEGASPIHPPGYGLTQPIEDYLDDEILDEGALIEDMTRALLFHPSITSVDDISLEQVDDEDEDFARLYIQLTATLDDESEVQFGTALVATGEALV